MKARLIILLSALLLWCPAWGEDFEFIVIGDTRPRFESESFRPFENLIVKINQLKPSLIVNLGDLIYGYGFPSKEKQWNKYQSVIKAIEAPYYQVPGNHDTHSRSARKIYGRRFGKFYQSFDRGDCHFVLLDNNEGQRWGNLGPAQLEWLRRDLQQTQARSVFVFLHFPVWEPERITPEYYKFWADTLHPLFKASRVKAVFGGHYHTYGPTREFDGIRYFITGGGGAELRPEYRKSGGEYHFMKVKVTGENFDVRVVTEHGELTDPEADIMGGLQFAARNVSRIGIHGDAQELRSGTTFNVSVANPYPDALAGEASWVVDSSAFSVEPATATVQIPVGATRQYQFTLKALQDKPSLSSLPRLQFSVTAGRKLHRFHREVRFLQAIQTPYRPAPVLDGRLGDWAGVPKLNLGEATSGGELASCHDEQNLYLAMTLPAADAEEVEEIGFSDEVQIGLARRLSGTDFGGDQLRLGFHSDSREVRDRTPGHKTESKIPGARIFSRAEGLRKTYEVAIPLRLLKGVNATPGNRVVMDISFPVPDSRPESTEPANPRANSFAYRIRYGSDSLVPVYFVELNLERRR